MTEPARASDARILKPDGSQANGSATESDLRTQIAHLTEEREGLQQKLTEAFDSEVHTAGLLKDERTHRLHLQATLDAWQKQIHGLQEDVRRRDETITLLMGQVEELRPTGRD